VERSDKRGICQRTSSNTKNIEKRGMTFRREGETLLLSWVDKKPINMISTMHSTDMTYVIDKYGRRKMKPGCVTDYNAFIQGVDNADQYLALHPFMRKTVKWPKKAIFLPVAVHTVQLISASENANPQMTMEYLDCMKTVSRELLLDSPTTPSSPATPASPASITSTSMSPLRSPRALPPKRAPAKDLPTFTWMAKERNMSCYSFLP
jgi:hypothetical protein